MYICRLYDLLPTHAVDTVYNHTLGVFINSESPLKNHTLATALVLPLYLSLPPRQSLISDSFSTHPLLDSHPQLPGILCCSQEQCE